MGIVHICETALQVHLNLNNTLPGKVLAYRSRVAVDMLIEGPVY